MGFNLRERNTSFLAKNFLDIKFSKGLLPVGMRQSLPVSVLVIEITMTFVKTFGLAIIGKRNEESG